MFFVVLEGGFCNFSNYSVFSSFFAPIIVLSSSEQNEQNLLNFQFENESQVHPNFPWQNENEKIFTCEIRRSVCSNE